MVQELNLTELAEEAGVTPRTVRYYIQIGLLPSPGTGPGAHYDEKYLDRIRLIKKLQRSHLPLAEIREQLGDLDPGQVQQLLTADSQHPEKAIDYVRSILAQPFRFAVPEDQPHVEPPDVDVIPQRSNWERISLDSDIEIHVQRPLSRQKNRILDDIVRYAQNLLQEDQP